MVNSVNKTFGSSAIAEGYPQLSPAERAARRAFLESSHVREQQFERIAADGQQAAREPIAGHRGLHGILAVQADHELGQTIEFGAGRRLCDS